VIFEVNENEMTAHVAWSYNTVYSSWGGVNQALPNSNIFFDLTLIFLSLVGRIFY